MIREFLKECERVSSLLKVYNVIDIIYHFSKEEYREHF